MESSSPLKINYVTSVIPLNSLHRISKNKIEFLYISIHKKHWFFCKKKLNFSIKSTLLRILFSSASHMCKVFCIHPLNMITLYFIYFLNLFQNLSRPPSIFLQTPEEQMHRLRNFPQNLLPSTRSSVISPSLPQNLLFHPPCHPTFLIVPDKYWSSILETDVLIFLCWVGRSNTFSKTEICSMFFSFVSSEVLPRMSLGIVLEDFNANREMCLGL